MMIDSQKLENLTTPMTLGSPVGPNRGVTTSVEVEEALANCEVTFAGSVPEESTARWVHWLTQMSPHETLVAYENRPGGARATIYIIERTDDQGRTWSCVTSPSWTAGLFLSNSEARDFAVEIAQRETPTGGWDYAFTCDISALSYARVA